MQNHLIRRRALCLPLAAVALAASMSAGAQTAADLRQSLTLSLPTPADVPRLVAPDTSKVVGLGALPSALPEPAVNPLAPEGDPLPKLNVPELTLENATVGEALRMVLMGTGLSYTAVGGAGGEGIRINVAGLKGPLPQVMEELAEAGEFFYSYRDGRLRVTPSKFFTVPVPAVDAFMKTLPAVLAGKGARSVEVDAATATVSFAATRSVARQVSDYLRDQRKSLVQIEYELAVLDVTLNSSSSYGIQWNKFAAVSKSGNSSVMVSTDGASGIKGAMQAALDFKLGNIGSLSSVLSFLESQGAVRVIGQPRLTVISGGSNTFDVSTLTPYVKKISSTQGNANAAAQTTIETDTIKAGTEIKLTGRYSDGVVYTDVAINLSEILSKQDVQAGGQTLTNYVTASRVFKNPLRIVNGDTVLLAGILQRKDRSSNTGPRTGIDMVDKYLLASQRDTNVELSELVVILRPVVRTAAPASVAVAATATATKE